MGIINEECVTDHRFIKRFLKVSGVFEDTQGTIADEK